MKKLPELVSARPPHGVSTSILFEFIEAAIAVSDADFGNIQLVDPETGDLRIIAQRGFPQWWLEFWDTVSKGQGSCGTAMRRGERVIVEDVEEDPMFAGSPAALEVQRKAGVRAVQSTPILSRSGLLLGICSTHFRTQRQFDDRTLRLLDLLAYQVADVIDRARAEEALRDSEQRLALALSAARMGTFDWDIVTGQVLWSPETEAIWGLSAGGYEGTYDHWRRMVHPEDVAGAEALVERALVNPYSTYENEHRIVWPDGTMRWILARSTTVWDESLRPVRMVGINMDITERKETEARLQRTKQLLSETQRIAHVGGWRMDTRSGRGDWTPETFRIFGVSPATFEVTSSNFLSLVHPNDRPLVDEWQRVALRGDKAGPLEFRIIRPNGTIRTVLGQGELSTAGERVPQVLLGTVQDITERKRAEERERVLMAEVNHRAKNLLAVVQAVALQTAKVDDPKEFTAILNDRLAGLGASHDLLVQSAWLGVDTECLIQAQLAHFADLIETRILLDGPPVLLKSSAAQNLGMALHELATNASKYGALSTPVGTIHVSWNVLVNNEEPTFEMSWTEQNGPVVTPPLRCGFGQAVIVDMLEYALDAQVSLTYEATGLAWQMRAPTDEIIQSPETFSQ